MVIFAVRPATSFGSLKTLTKSSIVAVIPARYASSRLPGKVLIDLAGKPMIEHVYRRSALSNLEEVVQVPGIDLIYLGLFDICQSVGLPGQVDHPTVIAEVTRCCELIQSCGIAAGSMATSVEYVRMLRKLDYRFIAYLNDAAAMRNHLVRVLSELDA